MSEVSEEKDHVIYTQARLTNFGSNWSLYCLAEKVVEEGKLNQSRTKIYITMNCLLIFEWKLAKVN